MEYRRQDISVSYTKLSSSEPRKVRERGNDLAHRPVDRYYYAPIRTSGTRFDEVLSDLITESRLSVRSSRGVRLLLTGRAGSGKTTTCQWLSTLTADAPLGSLRSVNIIPFFVALRRVMKNRPSGTAATPRGRELVSSLLASNYDSHVDAWVESVLDSGRAFVLLDGLDELTELELLQTRTWLASLMDKYPRSHFMVTSRPEGLDDGFFMIEGFVHSSLMPLSEDDVRECVGAWFHAMEKSRPYADPAEWGQIKAKLLNAIEHRASIRTLASTPLLVAMLCSFYASDPDQEPRDQTELYEKVTDALIDKRERDREAVDLDFVNFRVDAKRHILGRVAWAMTENQETTIFRNEAYRRVSRNQLVATGDTFDGVVRACLANMPNVTQPVSDVSSYLVRRSTVLEEVVEGEISFVHRSFQEYFAALGLPEGSREKLGALAKTVNWSRVTSFAASRLDPRSSAALLTDLLSTARVFPDRRRHMILLAAECMNRMVELEPAVADSVRAAVWSIWPPEAPDEAQDFAAIGDPMLAWFDTIVERSEKDFSACILVAGLIGSRASLQFLSFLADKGGSPRNADDFLTHWDRYDYEQFATKVVRPLAQRGAAIRVDTCTKLAALKVVTNTRNLILDIKRPDGDLDVLKDFAHISEIDIRFGDLESLSAYKGPRITALRNA